MADAPKTRLRTATAAIALAALPVLYVLSTGPVIYCELRGWLPPGAADAVCGPVERLAPKALADRLWSYTGWWAQRAYEHGAPL